MCHFQVAAKIEPMHENQFYTTHLKGLTITFKTPCVKLRSIKQKSRYSHSKIVIFAKIAFFGIFKVAILRSRPIIFHENLVKSSLLYVQHILIGIFLGFLLFLPFWLIQKSSIFSRKLTTYLYTKAPISQLESFEVVFILYIPNGNIETFNLSPQRSIYVLQSHTTGGSKVFSN